jgi:hypothetical protein
VYNSIVHVQEQGKIAEDAHVNYIRIRVLFVTCHVAPSVM